MKKSLKEKFQAINPTIKITMFQLYFGIFIGIISYMIINKIVTELFYHFINL
jgi:hypothetical protein